QNECVLRYKAASPLRTPVPRPIACHADDACRLLGRDTGQPPPITRVLQSWTADKPGHDAGEVIRPSAAAIPVDRANARFSRVSNVRRWDRAYQSDPGGGCRHDLRERRVPRPPPPPLPPPPAPPPHH